MRTITDREYLNALVAYLILFCPFAQPPDLCRPFKLDRALRRVWLLRGSSPKNHGEQRLQETAT